MPHIIALTGATGFIGGAVLRRLSAADHRIRALVRPTSNRDRLSDSGVDWVEGHLGDLESLCRLVRGAETVVHCAGVVRGADSADFNRVNGHGTAQLVRAASECHPSPRFLLVSSIAARAPGVSPYAASKRLGEEELAARGKRLEWTVLRPPVVYGPGDKAVLPLFRWMWRGIAPVLGPHEGRFSLLYVEDLAEAVAQWMTAGSAAHRVYELHDGRPGGYGWSDVANAVSRMRGRRVRQVKVPVFFLALAAVMNVLASRVLGYAPIFTPGKVREFRHPDWVCDNALVSRETGWSPRVGLEEGLRRTLLQDDAISASVFAREE